jgi:hypothetical protein
MKLLIALFFPLAYSATPPDAAQISERSRELLDIAYRTQQVVRFCTDNPDSVYTVEIEGVTILVRCRSWVDWMETHEGE